MEIERRWALENFSRPESGFFDHTTIYQWYLLACDEGQVRVSKAIMHFNNNDVRYTLNIKHGNGLSREEVQIQITYEQFRELIAQCGDRKPIKKEFWGFKIAGDKELEVSLIDDSWWYCEVEFDNTAEAAEFDLYKTCGISALDKTDDPEYAMKNYWRRTRG